MLHRIRTILRLIRGRHLSNHILQADLSNSGLMEPRYQCGSLRQGVGNPAHEWNLVRATLAWHRMGSVVTD
ncbi:protein of unknown function [Burkholderia multivorans]